MSSVVVRISNPADRSRGIVPEKVERFSLADATSVTRPVGIARFEA